MKKKALAVTIVLLLLLMISGMNFCIGAINIPVPHFFPDPLTISMDSINNSTVYIPNSEISFQFSVDKDIGTGLAYALYPSNDWFRYSIDDNKNMTANPSVVSREVSTVTSHNGGSTQIETTRYNVTIDLLGVSEGQHKIEVYIGVAAFLSDQIFPCGYRTFDPLCFVVGGLNIVEGASLTPTVPVESPSSMFTPAGQPFENRAQPSDGQVAQDNFGPELFTIYARVAMVAVAVCAGLLVCFKKRKH
jgi:hypothetical protein